MPTVPTSPLRALPVAPTVNPELFTQVPSFQEGQQAFEAGAKLPLMMETIKHEKKRIKMENSKLDFVMSEVGQRQEAETRRLGALAAEADINLKTQQANNFARQNSGVLQKLAIDKATADKTATQLAIDKAKIEKAKLEREQRLIAEGDKPLATSEITTNIPGLREAAIGASETFPFNDSMGYNLIPTEAPEPVAPPPESPAYVPTFNNNSNAVLPQLMNMPVDAESVAYQANEMFNSARNAAFPNGAHVRDADKVSALKEKFKPVREMMPMGVDDNGNPIEAEVVKINGKAVAVLGQPRLDISKRSTSQVKLDDEYGKATGADAANASLRVNALMNVKRLKTAADVLNQIDGELIEGSRLIALAPEAFQRLVAPQKSYSRDQVRTVIQQQLRATLGAQFARVEGEMMMDRAFSPLFEGQMNLELILQTAQVAETAINETIRREQYFSQNGGTLMGFKYGADLKDGGEVTQQINDLLKKKGGSSSSAVPPMTPSSRNTYIEAMNKIRNTQS